MSDNEFQSPVRYRLQVIVNRDLVCPPDGLDGVVAFELGKLADSGYTCVAHNVSFLKERLQKKRLGEFTVADVIPFIVPTGQKDYVVNGQSYVVKMNSQRYFVFRDSCSCVACGLTGTKMILEQHPGDKTAHFNLYAEEDTELVLMTKDHIRAKSVGGEDRLDNFATCCQICNNIKANYPITLEQLRNLRHLYNQNVRVMAKRDVSRMVVVETERYVEQNRLDSVDYIRTFASSVSGNNICYTTSESTDSETAHTPCNILGV